MGLSIVDISDPSQPEEITRMEDYPANCIVFGGGRLYVAKEYGVGYPTSQRVWQLDPTYPDSLQQLFYADPPGNSAFDLDYIYHHLFVASGLNSVSSTIGKFNILSKSGLSLVYSDNTNYNCTGISVNGNYIYVIDRDQLSGASNLYVYEAYDPASAYKAHEVALTSTAKDVLASDGYVYLLCVDKLLVYRHSY